MTVVDRLSTGCRPADDQRTILEPFRGLLTDVDAAGIKKGVTLHALPDF
jgi:hypothetical protein